MISEKLGTDLHPDDRKQVLAAYCHRMTDESVQQWPSTDTLMRAGGFRLPLISDQTWLAVTYFCVRKDGRLDGRTRHCRCMRVTTA